MEQKKLTEKQKKALIELQKTIGSVLRDNNLTILVDVADATLTAFNDGNIKDLVLTDETDDRYEDEGYSAADWDKGYILDDVPFHFFNSNREKVVVC